MVNGAEVPRTVIEVNSTVPVQLPAASPTFWMVPHCIEFAVGTAAFGTR